MSLEYIRNAYGVRAFRGVRVRYTPEDSPPALGVIVGSRNQYLRVKFDAVPGYLTLHPTWALEYLP